jgi:hypothetical protein
MMDLSCVCLQKQSERRPSLAPVLCTTTLFPFSFGKLVDGKIQIRKPAKKMPSDTTVDIAAA